MPHPFWDSLIKWKRWLTLALNAPPGHCPIVCLHPNQAHSVTPNLLIMKMTKRGNSSLLPGLMRLIMPARSPKVCFISLKLRSEIKELDEMLGDATKLHCRVSNYRHSSKQQGNLPGINADRVPASLLLPQICSFFHLLGMTLLPRTVALTNAQKQALLLDFRSLFLF